VRKYVTREVDVRVVWEADAAAYKYGTCIDVCEKKRMHLKKICIYVENRRVSKWRQRLCGGM